MWEQFILGIIQGIAEWLPISSEGMILLAKNTFLHSADGFGESIRQALYLHLGTFFAALIYFRKDVASLLRGLLKFPPQDRETRNVLVFLLISTFISGCLGLALLELVERFAESFATGGKVIVALIECLSRLKLLGRGAFKELQSVKDVFGEDIPLIGMYSNGEVTPFQTTERFKKPHHQNESIVVIAVA